VQEGGFELRSAVKVLVALGVSGRRPVRSVSAVAKRGALGGIELGYKHPKYRNYLVVRQNLFTFLLGLLAFSGDAECGFQRVFRAG